MDYKDWWFRTLDTLGFWGGVNSLYNNNVQVEAIKDNIAGSFALAPYQKNTVATSSTQKFDHPAIEEIKNHLQVIDFTGDTNSIMGNGINAQSVKAISQIGSLATSGHLVGGRTRPFQVSTREYRTIENSSLNSNDSLRAIWNWWPVTRAVSTSNPTIWYNGMIEQIATEQVAYYQRRNNSRVVKIRHWMINKKGQVYPNTRAKSQDAIRKTSAIIPTDPSMADFGDFSNYWQMAYSSQEITAPEYEQGSNLLREIFGENYTGTATSFADAYTTNPEGFEAFREWVAENGGQKKTVVISQDKTFNDTIPDWIKSSDLTYREMGEIWDMLQMSQLLFYLYGHTDSNREKIKARMYAAVESYENFGTITGEKLQDVINFAPWKKLQHIMKYSYFGSGRALLLSRFGQIGGLNNQVSNESIRPIPYLQLNTTEDGNYEWGFNDDNDKKVVFQSIATNIELDTGGQSQNLLPNKAIIEFFEPAENHTIFSTVESFNPADAVAETYYEPNAQSYKPKFIRLKRLPEGFNPFMKASGPDDPMVAWTQELYNLNGEQTDLSVNANQNYFNTMLTRGGLLQNITMGWVMQNLDWTQPRSILSDNRYGGQDWSQFVEQSQVSVGENGELDVENFEKAAMLINKKFHQMLNFQNSQWISMGLIRINNECIMDKPLRETCLTLNKYQEFSGNDSLIYTQNTAGGDYWMRLRAPRRMSSENSLISYDWYNPLDNEFVNSDIKPEMMVSGTDTPVQCWGGRYCSPFNLIDQDGTYYYSGTEYFYEKSDVQGTISRGNYLGFAEGKNNQSTTLALKDNHKRQGLQRHGGSTLIPTPASVNDEEFWKDYILFRHENLRIMEAGSDSGTVANQGVEIAQQQWEDSESPQYLQNNLLVAGERNEYGDLTGDMFNLGYAGWLQQRKNITPVMSVALETWFLTGNSQTRSATVKMVEQFLLGIHNAQKYPDAPRGLLNHQRNTAIPETQYQKFLEGQKPAFLNNMQNYLVFANFDQYRNNMNPTKQTLKEENIAENLGFTWNQFWEEDIPEKYGDMAKLYSFCVSNMGGMRSNSQPLPQSISGGSIPQQYQFAKIMLGDERDYENFFAENKKYQENARITVLPATENELKNQPFSIRGLKRLNPFKFMINWCRKLKARVKNLLD